MTSKKTPKTTQQNIDAINSIDIKTERLSLKKFSDADVEFNVAHEMDADIMHYIRDPMSLEKTRKKTKQAVPDWRGEENQWALIRLRTLDTDEYVGIVCFCYESIDNDTIEIGWRLGKEFYGKGLATEAAKALLDFIKAEIKAHKVVAYCVAENMASSNIMSKLGMQQEGCLRQFSKLAGKWFDEDIYGLIID